MRTTSCDHQHLPSVPTITGSGTVSRPLYESEEDRNHEATIARKIALAWGCEIHKTPPKAPYDYCVVKNGLIRGVVEIKMRKNTHDYYATFLLSVDKVVRCNQHAQLIGCPFIVVVQYTDALKWWRFAEGEYSTEIGGRFDRGDALDVEPVIHVPLRHFKEIG